MNRTNGSPWSPLQQPDPPEPQGRLRQAATAVQRLAELTISVADTRQALIEQLAALPMEAARTGFERPLSELNRIALQLDALYTELTHLQGQADPTL